MNAPKKLDDNTVNVLNEFFDQLDGKPPTSTQGAYAKLKKAMQNVGFGGASQTSTPMPANAITGTSITAGQITGNVTLRPFATSSSYMMPSPNQASQMGISNNIGTNSAISFAHTTPNAPALHGRTAWRMVMGLVMDEETGQQKYVSKAYFCFDPKEAKRNFITEYPEKTFTAVFVMEPVEGE